MSGVVTPPFAPQFGTGAPGAGVSTNQLYYDSSTTPFTGYVYMSGAWHTFSGGAGATGANPTATASDTAVNGVSASFMRADAAPAIQKGSNAQFGLAKGDGSTFTIVNGVGSVIPGGSGGPAFHPGYIAGQWYGPPGTDVAGASSNIAQNTICATPFYCPQATTFTKIGVRVTAPVAASHIELGVYANSSGVPGALILDCGQVSSAASAFVSLTGLTINIPAGFSFLVAAASAAACNISTMANSTTFEGFLQGVSDPNNATGRIEVAWAFVTGALPNPFTGGFSYSGRGAPFIVLGL